MRKIGRDEMSGGWHRLIQESHQVVTRMVVVLKPKETHQLVEFSSCHLEGHHVHPSVLPLAVHRDPLVLHRDHAL